MAQITDLKILLDLYGVGVRAGVITPQAQDEEYFRTIIDLPEMSDEVKADWADTNNVRKPLTLKQAEAVDEQIEQQAEQ